jgi:hypothetical protein
MKPIAVVVAFAVLAALSTVDLATTYLGLSLGYVELNPLALRVGVLSRLILWILPVAAYFILRKEPSSRIMWLFLAPLAAANLFTAFIVLKNIMILGGEIIW